LIQDWIAEIGVLQSSRNIGRGLRGSEMKPRMASSSFDPSAAHRGLTMISGKWKLRIIWHLLTGTKRFNELHRLLSGISRGTLTFELRQLQKDGIIDRTQYSTIPPTVEYKLTAGGGELKPILAALDEWSNLLATREKNSS
jgi:DNA-binding HxlR family transcriptional regulator